MKIAAFAGPMKPMTIEQRDKPLIAENELLVRTGRCGICATDTHIYKGDGMPIPEGYVLGHEFAGEVEAVGSAVTRFQSGDLVTAMGITGCGRCESCLRGELIFCPKMGFHKIGGFSQYLKLADRETYLLPPPLTVADGALVEPLAVGLHAVGKSGARYGDRALVLGAGAIGLATAFWLRRLGVEHVAVAARSGRRREIALKMGATDFVTLDTTPTKAVAEVLGGQPHVVFECVGLPGAMMQAMELVAPRGTVMGLGACHEPEQIVANLGLMKELRIQFALTYDRRDYQHVIDTLASGHLEPRAMVTGTVSLEGLSDAIEGLLGGSPHCKILVDPWLEGDAA